MAHLLHNSIGNILKKHENKFAGCSIIYDPACGISNPKGDQNIPLFCNRNKSQMTEYCNVDVLIIKNDRIKTIIEIDESDLKPTHIAGKFLTSALSSFYIHSNHNDEAIEMDESVNFIQIVDTSKLHQNNSSKKVQWENIEESIQNIIPVKGSRINTYKIIFSDPQKISCWKNDSLTKS